MYWCLMLILQYLSVDIFTKQTEAKKKPKQLGPKIHRFIVEHLNYNFIWEGAVTFLVPPVRV